MAGIFVKRNGVHVPASVRAFVKRGGSPVSLNSSIAPPSFLTVTPWNAKLTVDTDASVYRVDGGGWSAISTTPFDISSLTNNTDYTIEVANTPDDVSYSDVLTVVETPFVPTMMYQTNGTDVELLDSGIVGFYDHYTNLGWDVILVKASDSGDNANQLSLSGVDVLVVGGNMAGYIGNYYAWDTDIPIWIHRRDMDDNYYMASTPGEVSSLDNTLIISNDTHPINAGYEIDDAVLTSNQNNMNRRTAADIAPGAIPLSTLSTDPTKLVTYVVDTGGELIGSRISPNRRCFSHLSTNPWNNIYQAGIDYSDAQLAWLLNNTGTTVEI